MYDLRLAIQNWLLKGSGFGWGVGFRALGLVEAIEAHGSNVFFWWLNLVRLFSLHKILCLRSRT